MGTASTIAPRGTPSGNGAEARASARPTPASVAAPVITGAGGRRSAGKGPGRGGRRSRPGGCPQAGTPVCTTKDPRASRPAGRGAALLVPQGPYRVDLRGAPGGHESRGQGRGQQRHGAEREDERIVRVDPEELALHVPAA